MLEGYFSGSSFIVTNCTFREMIGMEFVSEDEAWDYYESLENDYEEQSK